MKARRRSGRSDERNTLLRFAKDRRRRRTRAPGASDKTRKTCASISTRTPTSPTAPTARPSWSTGRGSSGLDVVALTDHDTFAGLDEAVGPGRAGRGPGGPRDGAVLQPRGSQRASAGLRRRPGRTRPEPPRWSRSAAGRMGRLAGVLARLGRAGRSGDRGAGAGRGGGEPVGRPAAHRRRHGQGGPRRRPDRGLRPVPGRRWPGARAAVRHPGRAGDRPGPRRRRGGRHRPSVGAGPGARAAGGGAGLAGRRARPGRHRGRPPGPRPADAYAAARAGRRARPAGHGIQ